MTKQRSKDEDNALSSTRRQVLPRAPTQGRGVRRYVQLIDATERLLVRHSPDEIGLYQIAEEAGVPPASVYHFFPTKEAAFFALADNYLAGFGKLAVSPIPASALSSWQALMARDFRLAMQYYNAHKPALKIFLGGYGGEETRQADQKFMQRNAEHVLSRMNQLFVMPLIRDIKTKVEVTLQILDGIWRISYIRHGEIVENFYQEAVRACVAYWRLYLPEYLELRGEHQAAVERGDEIVLALSDDEHVSQDESCAQDP